MDDFVVCAFCLLSLQDIVISILSELDVIRCGKSEPAVDHDVSGVRKFWPSLLSENKQISECSWVLNLSTT